MFNIFPSNNNSEPIECVDPVLAYLSHSFLASRTLIMTTLVESSKASLELDPLEGQGFSGKDDGKILLFWNRHGHLKPHIL